MPIDDTAIGTTLALGSFTGEILTITPGSRSGVVNDSTPLNATSSRKKFPGALIDEDGFDVTMKANLSRMASSPPPAMLTVVLGTITEPGGGTLVGGCFVDSAQPPEMSNDEGMMEYGFHVTWTGYSDVAKTANGPVWTDGA